MKKFFLVFTIYALFCVFVYGLFSFQQLEVNPFLWGNIARVIYSSSVGFVAAMIVILSCVDFLNGLKAPNPDDYK